MSEKYVTVEDFENYKKHVDNIINKKEPVKASKQPNSYALYVKEMLPKIREKNPELSKNDLFKKIAESWKEKKEKDHKDQKDQ